jgi:RNA polymerase sigma-70 factor (ECF subfamily)
MSRTDEELIRDITKSDSNAFGIFYDRHSRLVYGALLRILKNTDEAEDILQDVFLQVWRKASTFDAVLGTPKNWLVQIAHNRAINAIRANRARMKQAEISNQDESVVSKNNELVDTTFFDGQENSERSELINAAFGDLPADQKELLEMAFLQGYSHAEISEALKVPLGTVKSKIRNGLLRMRRSLDFLKSEIAFTSK